MYLSAWTFKDNGLEYWEVVSGEDAKNILISELMDKGVEFDSIVIGRIIDEDNY